VLSYETMGVACLAVLWGVAVLVALAACQEVRDLLRLRARLRRLGPGETGCGMIEGKIGSGLAEDGALAEHHIEQVGRAIDGDTPAIKFHDRSYTSRVPGGFLKAFERSVRIEPELRRASVWVRPVSKAVGVGEDDEGFPAAYEAARTAKGYARTVTTKLGRGDDVFVAGEVLLEEGELVVRAAPAGELIVSQLDPCAFVSKKISLAVVFIVSELAICALATRIATWPPVFGRTSILGALLCIAFFLGVTPVGVAVRESCRWPSEARLRGLWLARSRSSH
jgi:hypothetical protein